MIERGEKSRSRLSITFSPIHSQSLVKGLLMSSKLRIKAQWGKAFFRQKNFTPKPESSGLNSFVCTCPLILRRISNYCVSALFHAKTSGNFIRNHRKDPLLNPPETQVSLKDILTSLCRFECGCVDSSRFEWGCADSSRFE